MADIYSEKILILDFGSQYTRLIARRVREAGVYSEIHPGDMPAPALRAFKPAAIILSGGPASVTVDDAARAPAVIFEMNVPILGICYGMHTMARQLGGRVETASAGEFGHQRVRARGHTRLLLDIQDDTSEQGHGLLDVWMSHGDRVLELPPGFKLMASSEYAPIAAIADEERRFYGLQFHPEVTHTRQGKAILERFLKQIAACKGHWRSASIAEDLIQNIRATVGGQRVLLALSGGVDSSVVAALLQRAVGGQLVCVLVDNGLLRLNEAEQITAALADRLGINIIKIDAAGEFLGALAGISDPERKRKIIGRLFIDVFRRQAEKLDDIEWLAQGTIYSDVIESAANGGGAHTIKSHHNVGGLPEELPFKLIEPVRELFKDEVRALGKELGLPDDLLKRHPFPGPGLGVRILGEVRKEYADLLRRADAIYIDELRQWNLYDRISQAFAVFLPVRAVGVMGDARRYDYVVSLRAVETVDFMTARCADLPYDFLQTVASRIINEVPGIARVNYDISSKPPATIEWE